MYQSNIKLLSLFSGIGAFEEALKYQHINYSLVNYCEIDKFASKSYSLIHHVPESMNLNDIKKVNEKALPKDIDLITYGFPCQDISLAGKQKGLINSDGTYTRSGLFFHALRIIEETKPKVAIAENVKNLVSKKFNAQFQIVLNCLDMAGYNNYYQVLNAKDYGIPQNRERVFIVSIRKDIDPGTFHFPNKIPLELRLKDMLEHEVDEKYYLSEKMIKYIVADNKKWIGNNNKSLINKSVASTINTGEGSRRCDASNYISEYLPNDFDLKDTNKLIQVGDLDIKSMDCIKRVYDSKGISPTITTMGGGNTQPKIIVAGKVKSGGQRSAILDEDGICSCLTATDYKQPKQILIRNATKKGYLEAEEGDGVVVKGSSYARDFGSKGKIQDTEDVYCTLTSAMGTGGGNVPLIVAAAMRGRGEDNRQQIEVSDREYANAITTVQKDSMVAFWDGLRIRKLTPKECWRLMGFDDEDIDKCIKGGMSNAQLYKQAGNSIVVDVLESIFVELFKCIQI